MLPKQIETDSAYLIGGSPVRFGRSSNLAVMRAAGVPVRAVTVVVLAISKAGRGKQDDEKGSSKNLFHAMNVARMPPAMKDRIENWNQE